MGGGILVFGARRGKLFLRCGGEEECNKRGVMSFVSLRDGKLKLLLGSIIDSKYLRIKTVFEESRSPTFSSIAWNVDASGIAPFRMSSFTTAIGLPV